jgi:hypothetical protein
MSTILSSRLDITAIFCDVDDFYQTFERHWQQQPMLTATCGERIDSEMLKCTFELQQKRYTNPIKS